jgi:GT2 family glycosyltransferase
MVRRDLFEKMGYFDEIDFPMYLGEADLSARLRGGRFGIVLVPAAIALHDIPPMEGGISLLRGVHITEPVRAYFVGRNRLMFMKRHSSLGAFAIHVAVFEPMFFSIHLFAMLSGHGEVPLTTLFGAYLRGALDGLCGRVRWGRRLLQSAKIGTQGH